MAAARGTPEQVLQFRLTVLQGTGCGCQSNGPSTQPFHRDVNMGPGLTSLPVTRVTDNST